jgi:hypothetical protein
VVGVGVSVGVREDEGDEEKAKLERGATSLRSSISSLRRAEGGCQDHTTAPAASSTLRLPCAPRQARTPTALLVLRLSPGPA